ncbi:MAG: trimethylamine methyltransferase family protein [Candidatus Lokiarchaeota archaeon]|nr:trimethylamine methyltransferase family protein [Candidatus Lokiarchaeota archaeon]
MKLQKLEALSHAEVETIHESTLRLLEDVGVMVHSQEARDLLKQNGCIIDESPSNFFHYVKYPRHVVEKYLKLVPDKFTLHGVDGSYNFTVDTETTHYATVGTPVKIFAPEKKKSVRTSVLADTINQIRVVDSLKNIKCSHSDVWANDVEYLQLHCHVIKAWAKNSRKPFGLGALGRTASQDMMNLLSILVGGGEELKKRPRLIGFYNPTSPLLHPTIMLNGLVVFAKYKQPLIIAPAASAGSTAPVTLAGLIVQTNMEALSAIVLTQMVNSGAPVLYSTMSAPMDPLTSNVSWGSIETGLITSAFAQLGRYYRIPSRGPGCVTESKIFDIQNGYERFMTLFCAATSGINYITCAGTYESSLTEALELWIIDDDLMSIVSRAKEGIMVDDNTLATDVIREISQKEKKHYLGHKHSVRNIRNELYVSKLADRNRRTIWKKNGSKDIVQRAKEIVEHILETQKGLGMDPAIEKRFDEYWDTYVKPRTMDDFRKLEGMENATESGVSYGQDITGG